MAPAIRVFLLDDHTVIREGIRGILERQPGMDVVGEAGTVKQAKQLLEVTRPDVAIIDVRLPDGNGIEVIRDARSHHPETRCVIFTSFADDEAFFQSVVAGSSGYLVKDVEPEELVASVRVVAEGRSLIRRELIDDLRRRANALPPEDELLAGLTGQERRILGMVTDGMTNREIAGQLSLAEKTVRNYVSNLLGKLGMKNRTQMATYVARRITHGGGPRRQHSEQWRELRQMARSPRRGPPV